MKYIDPNQRIKEPIGVAWTIETGNTGSAKHIRRRGRLIWSGGTFLGNPPISELKKSRLKLKKFLKKQRREHGKRSN